MPVYCYRTAGGEVLDRTFHMGKAPRKITTDAGEEAVRSMVDENKCVPPTRGWPIICVASGVHPEQAGQLREHLAEKGVPTEVTRDGDPIYRNAAHRKKALTARGMHDRNSFS